jgi:hypothetical protein
MLKTKVPGTVLAAALTPLAMTMPVFAQPALEATTHFGFAIEDRSTTGFKDVGGSLVYLDATHSLSSSVAVGLRTLGQGGHAATGPQYYRLGTGPAAIWKVNDSWLFDFALSRFEESGLDAAGGRIYRSTGFAGQLGYEHVWALAPRAEGALGGFASLHRGTLAAASAGGAAVLAPLNAGLGHGLEMALRVAL